MYDAMYNYFGTWRSGYRNDFGDNAHDDPTRMLYMPKYGDQHRYANPQTVYGYQPVTTPRISYVSMNMLVSAYTMEWDLALSDSVISNYQPNSVMLYEYVLSYVLYKIKIKHVLKDRNSFEYRLHLPVKILHVMATCGSTNNGMKPDYDFGYYIRRRRIRK
jgi:hypothetical protein